MPRKQDDIWLARKKSSAWQMHAAYAVLAAAAFYAAVAAVLPAGLVLPVFSLAAFAMGAGLALYGWFCGIRRESSRLTCWDYASTSVFLGFATGTLGNPEHVASIVGGLSNL